FLDSGSLITGTSLTVTSAVTNTGTSYTISGPVNTGGSVTLTAGGGPFTLLLSAPMIVGTSMLINADSAATGATSDTMNLLSSITTGTSFTLTDGGNFGFLSSILMSGATNAGTAISIGNAAATGTLSYTLLGSGSLTGSTVTVTGHAAANSISFFGNVTGT